MKTVAAAHPKCAVTPPAGATGPRERRAASRPDFLANLIRPLRAIINAFPVELPEPLDGETWLCVDSAMTGLYGALAALEDIDRRRDNMAEWNDSPPRCGE